MDDVFDGETFGGRRALTAVEDMTGQFGASKSQAGHAMRDRTAISFRLKRETLREAS
jgi:hypothetical protein